MRSHLFILCLAIQSASFAQSTEKQSSAYDRYEKSRKEYNLAGFLVLGTGTLLIAKGYFQNLSKPEDRSISNSPGVYYYVGGLAILASTPFFIIAAKNKKKALLIRDQPTARLQPMQFTSVPSLTFRITF